LRKANKSYEKAQKEDEIFEMILFHIISCIGC
jgi:hypothetical protein